jgi:hypothetical protein
VPCGTLVSSADLAQAEIFWMMALVIALSSGLT